MPPSRTVKKKVSEPIEVRVLRDVQEVARDLGVIREFEKLPPLWRGRMGCVFRSPGVELDKSLADDPNRFGLVDEILKQIRVSRIASPTFGVSTSMRLALSAIYVLSAQVLVLAEKQPDLEVATKLHKKLDPMVDELTELALTHVRNMLVMTVNKFSRMEECFYSFSMKQTHSVEKGMRYTITLYRTESSRVPLNSGGVARTAWACGGCIREDFVDYVKIHPRKLGLDGPDDFMPVYVQAHALEQLYDRMGAKPYHYMPRMCLYFSLMYPQIMPTKTRDGFLFECNSLCGRLGYFVLKFYGDHWLVHTFLFLTMDGTPEGRKLQRRLGVCRQGIENARLDRLETITRSDVRRDPILSEALRDCGCGHLMDAGQKTQEFVPMIPRANHVRRVLGLMPWNGQSETEPATSTVETMAAPINAAAVKEAA